MRYFRALEILVLIVVVSIGFFVGKISPEAFFGFATGLVVWWFKSRDETKLQEGQKNDVPK